MKVIEGGITAPKGFKAASTAAGIKYQGRTDMAAVLSEAPCNTAGVFTKNVVKAAPVLWDRAIVEGDKECLNGAYEQAKKTGPCKTESEVKARAIVINSGIANACTGKEGYEACIAINDAARKAYNLGEDYVFVCSTGVIGMQLPVDRMASGAEAMKDSFASGAEAATAAAKAIMTTDTVHKEVAVTTEIGGKTVTIGGMCKGSGMIHPNMCTMLGFIATDAAICKSLLQKALSECIEDTFNMVSVDGDTSTNDTVLLLANGMAGNEEITAENEDYKAFKDALNYICTILARKIAGDGEGATALFEVKVIGAASKAKAKVLAKSVVTSSLTKAAIYGHDANWGRILCALGYSGETFEPDLVDIFFESKNGKIQIAKNGCGAGFDEETATKILTAEEVTVTCDMHEGDAEATAWGCDLTHEYVNINADYRS